MLMKITKVTNPLGVPYARRAEDQSSHSYIDLKQHPDGLKDIPEIHGWPELSVTLEELNQPASAFRTLGCEKAEIDQGEGLCGISGYVQIGFEDLTRAKDEKNYAALFQRFHQHAAKGWPDNDTVVEFEMQPTLFIELGETCWSFSFWLVVRNCKKGVEAREKWSSALKFFREFLLADSAAI